MQAIILEQKHSRVIADTQIQANQWHDRRAVNNSSESVMRRGTVWTRWTIARESNDLVQRIENQFSKGAIAVSSKNSGRNSQGNSRNDKQWSAV